MKYYRDITAGETLQAGDEKLQWPLEWVPVNPAFFGASPSAWCLAEYRRPVDLPTLQPVTPEAMAELEGRGSLIMLFNRRDAPLYRYEAVTYDTQLQGWFGDFRVDPLEWHWYIEVDTIPEVQQ